MLLCTKPDVFCRLPYVIFSHRSWASSCLGSQSTKCYVLLWFWAKHEFTKTLQPLICFAFHLISSCWGRSKLLNFQTLKTSSVKLSGTLWIYLDALGLIFYFVCWFVQFNFVGKILGPQGNTIKRLQEETGAKISVLGKGSMRDKTKVHGYWFNLFQSVIVAKIHRKEIFLVSSKLNLKWFSMYMNESVIWELVAF